MYLTQAVTGGSRASFLPGSRLIRFRSSLSSLLIEARERAWQIQFSATVSIGENWSLWRRIESPSRAI